MVVKHRRKSGRKLGHHDHDGLRRRGHGNKGGFGNAGNGKRGSQREMKFIKMHGGRYNDNMGFSSIHKKIDSISVGLLCEQVDKYAEKKGNKYYINLKGNKLLGNGTVTKALVISNYDKITQRAKDKILKAGGEILNNEQ